jgi:hypothetical protein
MNICKNILRKFSVVTLSAETKKYPLCKDCKFFISEKNISIGKCQKFGSLNLVTGEIQYEYASVCRVGGETTRYDSSGNGHDVPKCGYQGLLFENISFIMKTF